VTVTSATPGATIRYTTNGVDPTESDRNRSSQSHRHQPVADAQGEGVERRVAAKRGGVGDLYPAGAAAVVLNRVRALYTSPPTVTIAAAPGADDPLYDRRLDPGADVADLFGPLSVATTSTLQAFAVVAGWLNSSVAVAAYTMNFGTLVRRRLIRYQGRTTGA
jgi:hypothetical protein